MNILTKQYLRNLIGKEVLVTVDRAMGSKHPKYGFIYPVNYGYIGNIIAGDGEELDAYILGIHEPLANFKGNVIAVINRLEEDDPKLIVTKIGVDYSDEAIIALVEFQEKYFKSEIIR